MKGPLLIVSGPSGCGKSTVLARLLQTTSLPLRLAVSATTRKQRPGESDGVQYYFWDRPRFEEEIQADGFLERAEVYGNYYGTSAPWIRSRLEAGQDILLEIDWQGAEQVRKVFPGAIGIFIAPPSIEELERRLRGRDTDTEEVILRRLNLYEEETAPLLDWYKQRDLLVEINGTGSPDAVTRRVVGAIDTLRRKMKGDETQ